MSCEKCTPSPGKLVYYEAKNGKCIHCGEPVFTPTPPPLGSSLDEAKKIILGERQDSYGNPEDSFAMIAMYWETYLGTNYSGSLSAKDVAHMMMLFKIARCSGQKPCRDNYVDIQGYAAIAADRL